LKLALVVGSRSKFAAPAAAAAVAAGKGRVLESIGDVNPSLKLLRKGHTDWVQKNMYARTDSRNHNFLVHPFHGHARASCCLAPGNLHLVPDLFLEPRNNLVL